MRSDTIDGKLIKFLSTQEEIDAHQAKVEEHESEMMLKRLSGEDEQRPGKLLDRIVVVGCGGTGSWLIPKLAKTINDMKRKQMLSNKFSLILVDGDTVEDKNLIRQNFIEPDIGSNKAEVMALRYGPVMSDIPVRYIDKYLTIKTNADPAHFVNIKVLGEMIDGCSKVVIFNLVDNQNARRAVHSLRMNGWIVDIGNELVHGQLFATPYGNATWTQYGELKFFSMSPETLEQDEEVKLYSCAEADVDEALEEQFLVANDTAALVGHNWLCSLMSQPDSIPARINFNCLPMPTVSVVLKNVAA